MKIKLPKKSQDHQETIEQIKDIIIERGEGKIAFVILFGSFARGDFVHDYYVEDGVRYSYVSDFDILIVIKKSEKGRHYKAINLKNGIAKEVKRQHLDRLHNLSIIIEPLKHVNTMLEEGQYFFSDIKKEGILLYQGEGCELAEPKKLTNEEKRRIAQRHFDIWFKSAIEFLKIYKFCFNEKDYKKAVFNLHQATENLFDCTLLVLTDYKPKTHLLEALNQLCSSQSNEFLNIFPKATEEQKECFELLSKAYIESRYNPDYKITKEQLEYLISKVERLKGIVEKTCLDKIKSFE